MRPRKRTYLDELPRLGMRQLHPHLLQPGQAGSIALSTTGSLTKLRATCDTVTLITKAGTAQHIALHWRTPHFGGYQSWFICPDCNRQRRDMYLMAKGLWACRKCCGAHPRNNSLYIKARLSRRIARLDALLTPPDGHRGMSKATRLKLERERFDTKDRLDEMDLAHLWNLIKRIDPEYVRHK